MTEHKPEKALPRVSLTDFLVNLGVDRGYGVPPGSYRTPEQIWGWLLRQQSDGPIRPGGPSQSE